MLDRARDVISRNRSYSLMLVFIIFMQVYLLSSCAGAHVPVKEEALTTEEFQAQIEERRQALEELIRTDYQLAAGLGLISVVFLALFAGGCVILANYIIKKRVYGMELIPRTLEVPKALWSIGDVARVVILFLFFYHLFSAAASLLTKASSIHMPDRRSDMVAATLLMDSLVFLFVLRFVIIKYCQSIAALGISAKCLFKNIGIAAASYIAFIPILALVFLGVITFARLLNYTPPPEPVYELIFMENRPMLLVVISMLISLIGPVAEEVFFRGFLYGAFRTRFGISRAILLSAFLFSFLHTNPLGFVPIFLLGAFLAYIREKTGSLIPCISIHILHNGALAAILFFVRGVTSKMV